MSSQPVHTAHILLMSADPRLASQRSAQLALAGWEVLLASESIEALAAVRNRHVDLALVHLPADDMVAMDLPNVLRGVSSAAYLPVIILADSPAEQHRCRLLDSGADDVLCTSTGGEETLARIRAMLRIKELHDQLATSRIALQEALRRERKLLTKLRRDNANLQILCTTDPLTHAQNVRSFQDLLEHEFRVAKRYNQPLSLLMLDMDHFKVVNDTHGHPSGDYVLKEFTVILKQSVRESDVVARIGGEEFAVLLPQASGQQALQFAERIRREVGQHKFVVYERTIRVTVSIGLATYPTDPEVTEPQMLLYLADQALLLAKEKGRDRVVAVKDLDRSVRSRLRRQYAAAPAGAEPEDSPCASIPMNAAQGSKT